MNYFDLAVKTTSPELKKYDFILSTGQELSFFARTESEANEKFIIKVREFCQCPNFEKGKCMDCEVECQHEDGFEDNTCLTCGEYAEPDDPRNEPEWGEDR